MSKAKKRPIIRSDSEESEGSDNLDQEVLSLATPSVAVKRPKLDSPAGQSSGSGSSSESGSDNEWTMDGKSGSKKSKVNVVKRGRGIGRKMIVSRRPHTSSESSDEEEEITEGPKPFTAGGFSSSGAGQSSSSDSESSSGESLQFDDGLDDELIGDEEDRKKLDQMTEAEREKEMFNRYEKRQAMKTRFEIEQRLRKERKAEKKRSKQREKQRRPARDTRARQQDKSKSKAMDELKAKRSADKIRKAEAEKQQQQQKKEPLKASDIYSSGSDEESSSGSESSSSYGDSDDETGAKTLSSLRREAGKSISSLEQLNKIKLSRYRLEKWVHMPFFKDTVVGCYVRIGIGAHDGRMVYRVCEIVNVQEGPKVYTIGATKTNKTLRLKHASQERQFRMEYVSNSQFSETEFSKWIQELESQGLKPPTVEAVHKKAKQIEAAKNFSIKDEDIERMIKEKEKFRKNPRNYAMTKNRLIREKELAEIEGDHDRAGKLTSKIEEIEERAEELDKQRTKGLSAISYINERNRQRNVIRAEQALKEEMAATDKDVDDPFTRRKCQPTLVTLAFREGGAANPAELLQELSQSKSDQSKEPVILPDKEKAPEQVNPDASNGEPEASGVTTTLNPPKNVEDLFSAHDFDIQIDLPTGSEVVSSIKSLPKSTPIQKSDAPRRSLNLSDYKKRRGLI